MKVACLLDSLFEDSEFKKPYDALRKAGHDVTIIGLEAHKEVEGYKQQVAVETDQAIEDVRPDEFDALLIPGGMSPDHLRADERMVAFAREMMEADKPTFAICHGPQLLITAEVVEGRRMTAWPTIQRDLEKVGAEVVDKEVQVDGNLVTSRKPEDIPAFNREMLAMLEKRGKGQGATGRGVVM